MIDPKELRIGNYIFDKDWDAARPIGATDIYNTTVKGSDNFELIKLTPEWLQRCGDKCGKQDWQYQIQVGAIKWYFRWNTEWYSELGGIYLDSRIQYLHQVQNLYQLLIGNEIVIRSFN